MGRPRAPRTDALSSRPLHDGEDLRKLLLAHPHVIATVFGHTNENRITAFPRSGGGGFRAIESPSHIGRAVLALSSPPAYTSGPVRAASTVRALRRRLGGERRVRVGASTWCLARGRPARRVFRTTRGRVREVGLGRPAPDAHAHGARAGFSRASV